MKNIICFVVLATSIQAQDFKILRKRGDITFISSQNEELDLEIGKSYKGPGIVKSGEKSFVRLQLSDKNFITVGSNSSVKVEGFKTHPATLINLLKGKIRGQINKAPSDDHKMYINTRSAALGVRGTDFIVTYNDKNHITSNITLDGEVDIYKKSDTDVLSSLKEDLDQNNKDIFLNVPDYIEYQDKLSDRSTISVESGKFSGAYPIYDYALPATKLAQNQVKILQKNRDLNSDLVDGDVIYSKRGTRKKFKLTNKNLIPEPKSTTFKEKMTKEEKRLMAELSVRPGGVIDLKSGMYIMPPEGSFYDEREEVYEMPADYGGVDAKTGEYIPPKDVEIDPLLGFVKITNGIRKQIDEFSKEVNDLFSKYKNITRIDLNADARYYYSLKSYENYYGELRNISDAESMIFDFSSDIGRHLFNNQRYLHYIKADFDLILHNRRDEPKVQRNDRFVMDFSYQFHRKHYLFRRKANLITKLSFETIYQDFRNKDQFDFFSESSSLSISEKAKLAKNYSAEIGWRIQAYQGAVEENHGNIWYVFWRNEFESNSNYSFLFNTWFSQRDDKLNEDKFLISHIDLGLKLRDVLRKTDLIFNVTNEWQDSEEDIFIDKNKLDIYKLSFERRKGEYLKIHGFYEYMKNDSSGTENRDFIQQIWGGGLKFIF